MVCFEVHRRWLCGSRPEPLSPALLLSLHLHALVYSADIVSLVLLSVCRGSRNCGRDALSVRTLPPVALTGKSVSWSLGLPAGVQCASQASSSGAQPSPISAVLSHVRFLLHKAAGKRRGEAGPAAAVRGSKSATADSFLALWATVLCGCGGVASGGASASFWQSELRLVHGTMPCMHSIASAAPAQARLPTAMNSTPPALNAIALTLVYARPPTCCC
jgi:hypothetical protein